MEIKQKKISAEISLESHVVLEEMIASGKASDLGEAIDLAIEEMRRAGRRNRDQKAEPYSAGPTPKWRRTAPPCAPSTNPILTCSSTSSFRIVL